MSLIHLFGEAIQVRAPKDLVDASDLRQIPDNQEVLLYTDSSVSIVVEILESVGESDLQEAVKFHFESLASDNEAFSHTVLKTGVILNDRGDDTPSAVVLSGDQYVAKFNRSESDQVRVYMALYRVTRKNIDLVVTFNVPTKSADDGAVGEEGLKRIEADFDVFVRSLRIIDFGLFA